MAIVPCQLAIKKINLVNKNENNYLKYSTLGLQMVAFVVVFTFIGRFLDQFFQFQFPVFTLILIMIGLFGALYYMIKKLK